MHSRLDQLTLRGAIVIPARMAASRLPGKPLCDLGGVPLVVRVAQQAQKCQLPVIVASEDEEIGQACQQYGLRWQKTPATATGTDKVAWVAAIEQLDWVINVQGDEPFVAPQDISQLALRLEQGTTKMCSLWRYAPNLAAFTDPHFVKVVISSNHLAMYFSRAAIPAMKPTAENTAVWQQGCLHIGLYGYTRAVVSQLAALPIHALEAIEGLEQLRALAAGIPIVMLLGVTCQGGIDTPADLARARQWLQHNNE